MKKNEAINKKPTKITELIADDKNFNKGSDLGNSLINKSLSKFGAGRSILLDKNNRIIAGNKTIENMAALGLEDVEVIESDGKRIIAVKRMDIDLDSPEGREMALADNAAAKANIVFDADLVEAEVGEVVAEEWGIELPENELEEDNFDAEPPKQAITVLGDVYELNQHRLICGDSTQTDTFSKLMDGKMADMVLTDPPYNVAYEGKTKKKLTIENDKQGDGDFYKFLYDFYTALGSYTKAGGVWYVWHADSEGANFRKAMSDAGIMVKQCLIWVKQRMVIGRQDYQWKHEPCLYGWKEGAAHGWYSDRKQTTVLNFDRPSSSQEHPTMKPIPLFGYQISNSSKEGDIVVDAFGGSGTTLIAAEQLQRIAYLVEFGANYCDVIVARFIKYKQSNATEFTIKRNGVLLTTEQIGQYLAQIDPKKE